MIEVDSKTFKSGNSEALRLPKEVALGPGVEVRIRKIGDTLEIRPKSKAKMTPKELVARLREIGRPQGPRVGREKIIFPKRRGL
jgi:antitoxin VapB